MKEIIYNYDNLTDKDINNMVERGKILVEDNENKIMIVLSHNNYFFVGGHIEAGEDIITGLKREIMEEAGTTFDVDRAKQFMKITYYNKDYPSVGINSKYSNYYYALISDVKPNLTNRDLTEDEKDGNFTIKFIPKNDIVKIVEDSLATSSRPNVTRDTVDVLKEYLNTFDNYN